MIGQFCGPYSTLRFATLVFIPLFGNICLSDKVETIDFNAIRSLFYPHSKVVVVKASLLSSFKSFLQNLVQTMIPRGGCLSAHQHHVPWGKNDFQND